MSTNYMPEGYHTVTPYLVVMNVPGLIEFLKHSFDAVDREYLTKPDGGVMHAEVLIGDSIIMMGEPDDESNVRPALLYLYAENIDEVYGKAISAGATSLREPEDQFYGDRTAAVNDAFGNQWWLATHGEDTPPDEMQKRAEQLSD
jgi:PhnB protein